jgi:hypothetical protein
VLERIAAEGPTHTSKIRQIDLIVMKYDYIVLLEENIYSLQQHFCVSFLLLVCDFRAKLYVRSTPVFSSFSSISLANVMKLSST